MLIIKVYFPFFSVKKIFRDSSKKKSDVSFFYSTFPGTICFLEEDAISSPRKNLVPSFHQWISIPPASSHFSLAASGNIVATKPQIQNRFARKLKSSKISLSHFWKIILIWHFSREYANFTEMFCFATAEPIIFPLSKKKRKTVTLLGHMFTSVTPLAFRKVKRPAKPNVEGCDVWFRSGGEIWIFMPFLLSNLRAWKREKSRRCCSHFFSVVSFQWSGNCTQFKYANCGSLPFFGLGVLTIQGKQHKQTHKSRVFYAIFIVRRAFFSCRFRGFEWGKWKIWIFILWRFGL